ncbi:hypothetical protein BAUCODRAFT_492446 [Baudoinia panamericana UAMH 10762]|uniref:Uncharacterized protein n=1 Tax=Baudoinia panamericana (strain UAMH 10762) TaxID=717646 RepID=M2ND80_BAUPA|nr:uncharacterized protein BAUCODRAFT_492446 [Baudoinia panamericana UAMH 10762]EMC96875.1 hypothetical protein BAUCODRAFT_492446 [Baudoinia panamericana UAMH 10762]
MRNSVLKELYIAIVKGLLLLAFFRFSKFSKYAKRTPNEARRRRSACIILHHYERLASTTTTIFIRVANQNSRLSPKAVLRSALYALVVYVFAA